MQAEVKALDAEIPYGETLVIVPTYDEAQNIERMIQAIIALSPELSILIVDDGSPDGTGALVESMQSAQDNLFLIRRSGKLGLGSAYKTGFQWALDRGFHYVVQMDCDFSHDPQDIRGLLQSAVCGADLVIGSRFVGGIRIINWPIHRLILSSCASMYTRLVTGMPVKDPTSGYKCLSRKVLEGIDFDKVVAKGYAFQIEVNFWAWSRGFEIKEYPIIFYERQQGESKLDGRIVREAAWTVLRLRLDKLLRRH